MRIVAKDLTFVYNAKTKFSNTALDCVSLAVEEGDFFGIIGHTGSGKSTFIQHLNGILKAKSGTLTIGDFDLSPKAKKNGKGLKDLRAKVGMVFQYPEYQLFEDSVFKDVAFGYKNFFPKATEEEIKTAVISAIDAVGLDRSVLGKSPFDLSGGQKRRVAIAGVIVSKPEILVLDEPVAGLDPRGKRELMTLLHSLHKTVCKTIIIVSHDMDEVAQNCNKIAVFSNGKIVMQGTTKEVFSNSGELLSLRLEAPLTATLAEKMKKLGAKIDTDFTIDDFTKKVADLYLKDNA